MDPKHRDRIAFFRLSPVISARYETSPRSEQQTVNLHNPVLFLAQDRETAEEAWAGDIMGIPNHGNLRIGDTLTEGETYALPGSQVSPQNSCKQFDQRIPCAPNT